MNDIANKLALIVCERCKRNECESDIDFSTRLLSVYNSCYGNIEKIIEQDNKPIVNASIDDYLANSNF